MEDMTNSDVYQYYQSLFKLNNNPCFILNMDGEFILCNEATLKLFDYTNEEFIKKPFIELIDESRLAQTEKHIKRIYHGYKDHFETIVQTKHQQRYELALTAAPIYKDGQIAAVVVMAKDITLEKKQEILLSSQNKILEMITKDAPISVVLNHVCYLVESVLDGGVTSILLLDPSENRLIQASSPNLPAKLPKVINNIPVGYGNGSCGTAAYLKKPIIVTDIEVSPLFKDFRNVLLDYDYRSCWSIPILDNKNNVFGVFAIYNQGSCVPKEDDLEIIKKATYLAHLIIKHYRAEERINFMAFHDDLTGLANRRLFDKRVRKTITEATKDIKIGLLYLDLDRFKLINDSLGHKIGDLLLVEVAKRLNACITDQDTASRQGGDEFTILVNNVNKERLENLAKVILHKLDTPFYIEGHEIFVTPSIGISLYPDDGDEVAELIRKADVAMYQAKNQGRSHYQFYDPQLDKRNYARLELENELRKALNREEFHLVYQPIINLTSNEMVSVEALLRWKNKRLGSVSPQKFIPVAEETGMIIPIGDWVLRSACQQLKEWDQKGLSNFTLSVNLSIRQFYQPDLINKIAEYLKVTNIEPSRLTIEITESMTMNVETATLILKDLKRLGVNISVDDFGTGYSSLNYLKTFPIDYLKIDQSFTKDITKSKDDENIANIILLMAHNLGLKVIAEGVETYKQLKILRLNECDEAQGYLFSKPLRPLELEELVNSFNQLLTKLASENS